MPQTNRTCTPMRPPPAPLGGPPPWRQPQSHAEPEREKRKAKAKGKPNTQQTHSPPNTPCQSHIRHAQPIQHNKRKNTTTKQQTAGNEEQEPCPITPSTNTTNTHREGMKRIKMKNTGICRGTTHGLTVGCAPVGARGAGQRPSRNKVAAHCTAPSTVSNASVRTLPCPSMACTVRRAPSTPDCPGGRMRSFHGLGAPLRVARII